MHCEDRTALVRSRESVPGELLVNVRGRTGGRVRGRGNAAGASPVGEPHDQRRYRKAPHHQHRTPFLALGLLPAYFSDCHEFPIPAATRSLMTSCKLLTSL